MDAYLSGGCQHVNECMNLSGITTRLYDSLIVGDIHYFIVPPVIVFSKFLPTPIHFVHVTINIYVKILGSFNTLKSVKCFHGDFYRYTFKSFTLSAVSFFMHVKNSCHQVEYVCFHLIIRHENRSILEDFPPFFCVTYTGIYRFSDFVYRIEDEKILTKYDQNVTNCPSAAGNNLKLRNIFIIIVIQYQQVFSTHHVLYRDLQLHL